MPHAARTPAHRTPSHRAPTHRAPTRRRSAPRLAARIAVVLIAAFSGLLGVPANAATQHSLTVHCRMDDGQTCSQYDLANGTAYQLSYADVTWNCRKDCNRSYDAGTHAEIDSLLGKNPATGTYSGDCIGTGTACSFAMTSDRDVTVTFPVG